MEGFECEDPHCVRQSLAAICCMLTGHASALSRYIVDGVRASGAGDINVHCADERRVRLLLYLQGNIPFHLQDQS